jgi:hypothetical protein
MFYHWQLKMRTFGICVKTDLVICLAKLEQWFPAFPSPSPASKLFSIFGGPLLNEYRVEPRGHPLPPS